MKELSEIAATIQAAFRTAAFLLMVVILVPIGIVYRAVKPADPFRLPMFFHGLLLKLLNIRANVKGDICEKAPVLFVSNHTSYLDIPVLGSLLSAGFVAKAEVADWPLFGFLAKLQNTIFIERRTSRAAEHTTQLRDYLDKKHNVVLFPEGTSSNGLSALPFKSSLFGIVEDPVSNYPISVQPVSITCVEMEGFPMLHEDRSQFAWYGDMTLVPHLWNVFKRDGFTVDVTFHPPIDIVDYACRKELAATCHALVNQGIHSSLNRRTPPCPAHALAPEYETAPDSEEEIEQTAQVLSEGQASVN